MIGHTMENYLSARTGICATKEVMSGFSRKEISKLGIFWVDLTRTVFYVLLPLACFSSVFLVSQYYS